MSHVTQVAKHHSNSCNPSRILLYVLTPTAQVAHVVAQVAKHSNPSNSFTVQ